MEAFWFFTYCTARALKRSVGEFETNARRRFVHAVIRREVTREWRNLTRR